MAPQVNDQAAILFADAMPAPIDGIILSVRINK